MEVHVQPYQLTEETNMFFNNTLHHMVDHNQIISMATTINYFHGNQN